MGITLEDDRDRSLRAWASPEATHQEFVEDGGLRTRGGTSDPFVLVMAGPVQARPGHPRLLPAAAVFAWMPVTSTGTASSLGSYPIHLFQGSHANHHWNAANQMLNSFGDWVNAAHQYRHAQGVGKPAIRRSGARSPS
jgi:hypothetical protein